MFEGITSEAFLGVFDEVKNLIPIILPAVIAFLGFRKGWQFLRGALKRA